jgi:hypothetical protein
LAVNETGRALIHLRQDVAREPTSTQLHLHVDSVVQALADFFAMPDAKAWQRADAALTQAIALARMQAVAGGVAARVLLHLRLVRLAMVDDSSVMATYIAPADHILETPRHAH